MSFTMQLSLVVLGVSITVSFFAGMITKNYSHTDRLWSILPPVYAVIWGFDFYSDPRFAVGAALVISWGIRLTWNFARRGGFKFNIKQGFTGEDYRWPILRQRINNPFLFELFNLFFISGFQLGLIFLFTLPLYYTGLNSSPLTAFDYTLFTVHLLLLILESVSDNQQYSFHENKNNPGITEKQKYSPGFNTFGLWRYSRHPNYVCEMGQWIVVWLYACSAAQSLHPSGTGVLLLVMLFAGSSVFTEEITSSRYPEYKKWKSLCSPWIPGYKTLFKFKEAENFLKESRREG